MGGSFLGGHIEVFRGGDKVLRGKSPESRVQSPESRVQSPGSRVQGPVQLSGYAKVPVWSFAAKGLIDSRHATHLLFKGY